MTGADCLPNADSSERWPFLRARVPGDRRRSACGHSGAA